MNSKRTMQNDVEGEGQAIRGRRGRHVPGMAPAKGLRPAKGNGNGDAAHRVPAQREQVRAAVSASLERSLNAGASPDDLQAGYDAGLLCWAAPPPLRQAAAELGDGSIWSALTATELTVAELLATGRSVGAVAKRLDLSRPAVERNLRCVYAKLGVRSRIELARAAEATAQSARALRMVDATRRQIERDLHDGLQQHLIGLGVRLSAAELAVGTEDDGLRRELHGVSEGLREVLTEVRQIARGVEPETLREHGLGPALQALAKRSPVPVSVVIELPGRMPEVCETTAYFVTAEALANIAKYARARSAQVTLEYADGCIIHSIRDDGVGGANPDGPGISGLRRRAEARGGSLELTSPPGGGTLLVIRVPFNYDS
jgi:signal transduction histidine kinase